MGQPLYCSAADAGLWGERGCGDGSTPYAWLSSIALLTWLPGFPLLAFPTIISYLTSPHSVFLSRQQPLPRDCSTIPKLQLPTAAHSRGPAFLSGMYSWGMYGCSKDSLILFPFRLPQISCFTLSLKCSSSDSVDCPNVGIGWPLLQFPHPLRAGPVLLTLLFLPLVPSSYGVLHGSIYSFPLVRYSCPLSAGILHALLCLKVYSWCSHAERCTVHLLLCLLDLLCPLYF